MNREINVSHVLPAIHVPTLLLAKIERRRFPDRAHAVDRHPDRRRPAPGVPRRCALLLGGGVRLDAAGDRALRRRVPRAGGGAGTVPRDGPVHRHRRLDRRPLRRSAIVGWKETGRGAPREGSGSARALSRHGDRHRGRRVLRDVRRSRPRDPLRDLDRSRRSANSGSRFERDCTPARSSRSATRSAGSPSTSAPAWRRWPAPSEVLASQTVKDLVVGLRHRVRGCRRARAERRPRPLAPLPRRGLGRVARPRTRGLPTHVDTLGRWP